MSKLMRLQDDERFSWSMSSRASGSINFGDRLPVSEDYLRTIDTDYSHPVIYHMCRLQNLCGGHSCLLLCQNV